MLEDAEIDTELEGLEGDDATCVVDNWRDEFVPERERPKVDRGAWHESFFAEYPTDRYPLVWDENLGDNGGWQLHTKGLEVACERRGIPFIGTKSESLSDDKANAIAFPLDEGIQVHRYGDADEPTWPKTRSGIRVLYIRALSFAEACKAENAVPLKDGAYQFSTTDQLRRTLKRLGVDVPLAIYDDRRMDLKSCRGALLLGAKKAREEKPLDGWAEQSSNRVYIMLRERAYQDVGNPILYTVDANGDHAGYIHVRGDGSLGRVSHQIAREILVSRGVPSADVSAAMGALADDPYGIKCEPFEKALDTINKMTNLNAAQHIVAVQGEIKEGETSPHPYIDKVLAHCGRDLDEAVKAHAGLVADGIKTGAMYLQVWISRLFLHPTEPLPYLFLYGAQNCGKSSLTDIVRYMLVRGWCPGSRAFNENHNGCLENAIFCLIEESDLDGKGARGRLNQCVSEDWLAIRRMRMDEYVVPNLLHMIHTANNRKAIPLFRGEQRIVPLHVWSLKRAGLVEIGRRELKNHLRAEASAFLWTCMHDTPKLSQEYSRLWLPVLANETKKKLIALDSVSAFIDTLKVDKEGEAVSSVQRQDVLKAYQRYCTEQGLEAVADNKFFTDFNDQTYDEFDGPDKQRVKYYYGFKV